MAIKGLADLLTRYQKGEISGAEAFEAELNKSLATDWIPKATFNELNEKHKFSDSQLRETQAQLETLRSKAGLTDEYKSQIEKLTSDHAAAKADFEKQIKDMKNDWALTSALSKAKAKDAKLVKSVLDHSKLIYQEDGSITGLDEQLKTARDSYSYLFEAEEAPAEMKKPTFGMKPPAGGTEAADTFLDSMRTAAGLK